MNPKFAEYANPDVLVDTEWLAANLGSEGIRIIESNEDILLYDTGHIPGAVNVPTTDNVDERGRFHPPERLRATYARVGADSSASVAAYCGSGVTAAHDLLAMEVAGIRAALYPGSWSGWITDPDRPVELGE